MKTVIVTDITLRVSAEKKEVLSFREKLHTANCLDKAGVDVIELPALSGTKEDAVIAKTIAESLTSAAAAINAGVTEESINTAWETIRGAKKPVLQIVLPASTVQMEYLYHIKAPQMAEKITALVSAAVRLCHDTAFVIADATRADPVFTAACAKIAEEAGAASVTLCDDSGVFFPTDWPALVEAVLAECSLPLYIQPSNALDMAAASAVSAVMAGAAGIKTAVGQIEYFSTESAADIYRAKSDEMGISCRLDVTAIHRILASIRTPDETPAEPEIPAEADSGLLDATCTAEDIRNAVVSLGYELTDEDHGKVREEFARVIAKKETIGARELEAIVATAAMQVPSTYHLVSYVVNSGNIITATANVTLEKNGETFSGVSIGDGPIDAAFHAIEQIIGHHYELDDFQVHAVTGGREAVGSSLIRLRANGRLYAGNGISTDIIGACVRAYINAVNKIIYDEN
ncbi:MAG: hypothetical protein IJ449_04200 [Clostridia bacterium]|nr:hypothetical protein [Clostridia bacterium]